MSHRIKKFNILVKSFVYFSINENGVEESSEIFFVLCIAV